MRALQLLSLFRSTGDAVVCSRFYDGSANKCRHSTKGKGPPSHYLRWNAENKILFGSKQNTRRKKKPETTKDDGKKASSKPKKRRVDSSTEARLKEMYQLSKGMDAQPSPENSAYLEEDQRLNNLSQANVQFAGQPVEFWEENLPDDKSGAPPDQLWDTGSKPYPQVPVGATKKRQKQDFYIPKVLPIPKVSRNTKLAPSNTLDISIPKVLPVPKVSKVAKSASKAKTSKVSTSSEEEENAEEGVSVSVPELDFVLRCPLFPDADPGQARQDFGMRVEGLGLRVLPSVKTILSKTRPDLANFFLQRWREKMIKELGAEGFKKHQEATIWQGVTLHACVQQFLSGTPLEDIQMAESNRGHWASLAGVLPAVTGVEVVEASVHHPWLHYKGTVDCVARYKNILCVIDWKTATKPKPLLSNLYDDPLQVAAYMGALNHNQEFTAKNGPVDRAAVVVAYPNGEAAHTHLLTRALCLRYWGEWCQRLHQYWATVIKDKT